MTARTPLNYGSVHTAIIHTTRQYNARRKRLGLTWRYAAELGIDYEQAARRATVKRRQPGKTKKAARTSS